MIGVFAAFLAFLVFTIDFVQSTEVHTLQICFTHCLLKFPCCGEGDSVLHKLNAYFLVILGGLETKTSQNYLSESFEHS